MKLGQDYIFTGICHSVNRGVSALWGVSAPGGCVCSRGDVSTPRGVSALGGLLLGGGLLWGCVYSRGVSTPRGVSAPRLGGVCFRGVSALLETPQDGHCFEWYASYWNAFLFIGIDLKIAMRSFVEHVFKNSSFEA